MKGWKDYLRAKEIFTAPAVLAGVTQSGVWNVAAVARAAPAWNVSPGTNPMAAVHAVGVVPQVTGMSFTE